MSSCWSAAMGPQRSAECIACVVGDLAVYTVDLTTVALGIHEGLVAYVADQQG